MAMLSRRFIPPEYLLRPLLRPVGQVDDLEDLVDAGPQGRAREPVQPAEEGQVLARAQVRVDGQVLGDVPDLRLQRGAVRVGAGGRR